MTHKRHSVSHKLKRIIERDGGWTCHYCGCNLIPPGTAEGTEPYYTYRLQEQTPIIGFGYFNGPDENWEAKAEAWQRGDLVFWYGYADMTPGYSFAQVDHVIPVSRGGSDDLSNLVAACYECNKSKLDRPYEVFMREIHGGEA
jgi:5-methylcytosine-specific restriction endonuclease McrA